MSFDFKKEYKEFYMPKNRPQIVNIPKANYIAVRGKGNPNEKGGAVTGVKRTASGSGITWTTDSREDKYRMYF